MITSPNVLAAVASDPKVARMDFLRDALDPNAALRDRLVVRSRFGTNLVEVTKRGLKAADRQEAHLVAERDRLAAAIAEHDASAASGGPLRVEIEHAEEVARTVRARLDRLRFEVHGGSDAITVISKATP